VSLVLYILIGFLKPEDTPERLAIIEKINTDGDGAAAAAIPTPAGPADRMPVKD
ncbi:MAG: Na+:solute symporter, partial [Streptomyces sp.]|nr:Na+:solute symporter [Streptomyces sp.]